ncbi:hypothetical protein NP026_23600 [Salmonella enterica]|nr:hypothetical protein [Salmonella enterica]
MIQNPINVFFSFFLKKTQFNFIQNLVFSGDFEDNHSIRSIRSLISVSIIQISSIVEEIGFDPCKKFFNFIFTIWVFDLVIAFYDLGGGPGAAPLVAGSKGRQPLAGSKGQSPWLGLL